jgi:hypothetical protein
MNFSSRRLISSYWHRPGFACHDLDMEISAVFLPGAIARDLLSSAYEESGF